MLHHLCTLIEFEQYFIAQNNVLFLSPNNTWVHALVLLNCRKGVALTAGTLSASEAWFCRSFSGTKKSLFLPPPPTPHPIHSLARDLSFVIFSKSEWIESGLCSHHWGQTMVAWRILFESSFHSQEAGYEKGRPINHNFFKLQTLWQRLYTLSLQQVELGTVFCCWTNTPGHFGHFYFDSLASGTRFLGLNNSFPAFHVSKSESEFKEW